MTDEVNCCQQGNELIEQFTLIYGFGKWTKTGYSGDVISVGAGLQSLVRQADYTDK
jgi:hypothetical protein